MRPLLVAMILAGSGRLFAEDMNKEREAELEWALTLAFEPQHRWPTGHRAGRGSCRRLRCRWPGWWGPRREARWRPRPPTARIGLCGE